MTGSNKIKSLLLTAAAAVVLAGCGGGSEVSSPGESGFTGAGGGTGGGSGGGSGTGAAVDCPPNFTNVGTITTAAGASLRNCRLPNTIVGTLTVPLRAGTIYSLSGRVDVGTDRGADPAAPIPGSQQGILIVEPGVTIFGSGGLDYLNVQRGSQLVANGSVSQPIVFTSRSDVEGTDGANTIGQWGGIVLSGRAPIASCPAGVTPPNASCVATFEGGVALYGGNTPTDNSGSLRFVQIKYPGFEIQPNRELNGLTLTGVGSGTVLENIQVHNSSDDGIEMFGGTANLRRIIITGADDDSIDTDEGYRGAVQFLIVQQRSAGGNRGFEMSSVGVQASLNSQPTIANFTALINSTLSTSAGPDAGQILNSGTGGRFVNGIIAGTNPQTACIDVDGSTTQAAAPRWDSVVLACPAAFKADADIDAVAAAALFNAGTNNNSAFTTSLSGFVNGPNEAARTPFNASTLNPAGSSFLVNTTYIGAVRDASDTWWQGWTCGLPGGSSC